MRLTRVLKILFLFLFAPFLFNTSLLKAAANVDADRIVAIVNDMIITYSEVQEYMSFAYIQMAAHLKGKKLDEEANRIAKDALTRLVEDKLILQQAVKQGIKIEESFISARVEEMKSQFGPEQKFAAALQEQNMSVSDLKKGIREQELMRAIVNKEIKSKIYVSPNEITQFYREHSQEFKLPEGRKVSFLVFDNKEDAKRALTQINNGKDISQISVGNPDYQRSKDIRKGKLAEEAERQIFSLNLGQKSAVINIDDKFYIFKILAILPVKEYSLSEAQSAIYGIIFNDRMANKLTAWLDQLKEKAYIVIK